MMGSTGKRCELLLMTPKVTKLSEQAEDPRRASPSSEDTGIRGDSHVFLM